MRRYGVAIISGVFLMLGLPLEAMAGPTPGGADTDGDGVENAFDNCSSLSNPSQKDVDHDGCGDLCDGNFVQNGTTGLPDYALFKSVFGSSSGSPSYNALADMDCNGTVGLPDFALFKVQLGRKAGPSGITNAGRDLTACPP